MAPQYGEVRVDYITYTTGVVPNEGTATAYVSGLINNPTFSGNVIIEGDATIDGNLNVSGDINASGVVISGITGLFDAGTEALPSIAFALDPNTGIYNPSANEVGISTDGNERLRVDNTGNVGIGTTSPSETLEVAGNTILDASNATLKIKQGVTGTTGAIDFTLNSDSTSYGSLNLVYDDRITQGLRLNTTYPLTLECGASEEILFKRTTTESARIDSSGRLLIGTSTALTAFFGTTANRLAIGGGAAPQVLGCYSTNQFGPRFDFIKSRSATVNGQAIVSIDDRLGELNFGGSDGTAPIPAARIICQVDGTPGTNDMPGRLVFFTTADGANTPTERMVVKSNGNVGIGTDNPQATLQIRKDIAGAEGANLLLTNDNNAVNSSVGLYFSPNEADGVVRAASITSSNTSLGATRADLRFTTANADTPVERMRIATDGNVGIGTSSPGLPLEVVSSNGLIGLLPSATNGNTIRFGGVGGTANQLIFTGSSDVERARIDSSGRLLIGTSTARANLFNSTIAPAIQLEGAGIVPAQRFLSVINNYATAGDGGGVIVLGRSKGGTVGSNTVVAADDQLGRFDFQGNDGTDFVPGATIQGFVDGTPGANDMPGRLVFSTTADGASTPTGRMRISSEGRTDAFGTSETLRVRTAATTAAASIAIRLQAGATSITAGGTTEFQVTSNGNVANTTNSYGAISDIKLKENIVDANSQWNDLKALQVRNYNFKEGQTHTQIGLVAQEAELVSPGLVNESPDHDAEGNDLGTVTKSVNYSVLYMKAVKALQEAMERIETFEQRLSDAGIA
jgi:hypothetical protein